MKGYKVVDPDYGCHLGSRKIIYNVGKTYTDTPGIIKLANHGFHFCRRLIDCFSHYPFDPHYHVLEIEILGGVRDDFHKSCTDKMRILRKIPWTEVLELVNCGKNNQGKMNYGNDNYGDNNYGNNNIGSYNCGNNNKGNYNKGNNNIGSYNYADNCIGYGNTINNQGTIDNAAINNQLTGIPLSKLDKKQYHLKTRWKSSPTEEEIHDIEEAEFCNGYLTAI